MSRPTIETVSSTIGTIYQAGFDRTLWTKAIIGLCDLFDGSRACIVHIGESFTESVASIHDEEFVSPRSLDAHMRDPLGKALVALPTGTTVHREQMVERSVFRRGELWQDWYRPRDLANGISCKVAVANSSHWLLDIQRGARQQEFDRAEVDLFETIVPHVMRAGQIGQGLRAERNAARSAIPFGTVVVDIHGTVIDMNEVAAAAIVGPDGPLRIADGKLTASDPRGSLQLRRLIQDACRTRNGALPGVGGSLTLHNADGCDEPCQLVLNVAPYLDVDLFGLSHEHRAVVHFRDTDTVSLHGFAVLARSRFKLTGAEARLAEAITSGRTLKQAAAELGITYKSGRTYLERIFVKTGVRQQSQLVALLARERP